MKIIRNGGNLREEIKYFAIIASVMVIMMLAGCENLVDDSSKEATRTALSSQQTEVAEKLLKDEEPSSEDRQSTQTARSQLGGQDSSMESKPRMSEEPDRVEPTETEAIEPTDTLEPTKSIDFETWEKSAKILLFEDMIGHTNTPRYVKETLDQMGLSYKDDGSAKGWLQEDLVGGPPGGGTWDLVIIAAESKTGVQGEFFQYVLDAIDLGSSVIMEVWYLNMTYNGTASTLLERCGIEYQNNWEKVPPNGMVMFPRNSQNPILHEPNELTFTKVIDYWWDPSGEKTYDIGDRVQLGSGGDAELLVGTHPTYPNSHATLTVCMDGQLILQTFSSHQLSLETMVAAWENYIHHALKTRYKNQN
jgi:hypothetical protein